ncbi:MAG: antirestriction protein ArdC [Phenylobacterium sp.]|jgi:antirestriction protein ArdC
MKQLLKYGLIAISALSANLTYATDSDVDYVSQQRAQAKQQSNKSAALASSKVEYYLQLQELAAQEATNKSAGGGREPPQ